MRQPYPYSAQDVLQLEDQGHVGRRKKPRAQREENRSSPTGMARNANAARSASCEARFIAAGAAGCRRETTHQRGQRDVGRAEWARAGPGCCHMLPKRAVTALQAHKKGQAAERLAAGTAWQHNNLVFCHEDGRMYTSDDEAGRHSATGTPTRDGTPRSLPVQQRRSAPGDQRHRGPQVHPSDRDRIPAGGRARHPRRGDRYGQRFGDPGEGDNQYGTSEAS